MSSTSFSSPAAIVRLLDLVKNNMKALPYPDVEGFKKFTGLATVAVESMESLVLFVLVYARDLAHRAGAAKALLVWKLNDIVADESLQLPMSCSVTPDSPSILPMRPLSIIGLLSMLANSSVADSLPPSNMVAPAVPVPAPVFSIPSLLAPPWVVDSSPGADMVAVSIFHLSPTASPSPVRAPSLPPSLPRTNKPLFLPLSPCVCSPPTTPACLVTPVAVAILEPPRSPSPASPMEVEEVNPSVVIKHRKDATVVVSIAHHYWEHHDDIARNAKVNVLANKSSGTSKPSGNSSSKGNTSASSSNSSKLKPSNSGSSNSNSNSSSTANSVSHSGNNMEIASKLGKDGKLLPAEHEQRIRPAHQPKIARSNLVDMRFLSIWARSVLRAGPGLEDM
ncbi:hypothetical protein BV22DRAFT_1135748 [Leucogyrophana mollusca]|uniref:Uncharacterized protein n=1 Tax=Leucogyrophana mollusca TaxID=85980 RepID=A0ACB8AUL3_9AGAM|nr:hypothetical protein BV22DRAFT_1135748 [Leucogyrophana mollusca]